jgi:hypothetical protein
MIKTVIRVIASAVALFLCATLITALFFSAVLQESYKLCPLTEQEVLGE